MESSEVNPQLELLAKIHNQLVDLNNILVEIETMKPGTSPVLKTRLRQILGDAGHIDATGHSGGAAPSRKQMVITPDDNNIQTGEGRE